MKLVPDDDIYRFAAVWRDLRGWSLPFVARYVVWAAWFVVFIPTLFVVALVTPFNFGVTLLLSIAASAAVTYFFIADKIDAENSLEAVAAAALSEIQSLIHEAERAKVARSAHSATLDTIRIEEADKAREATWNPIRWFRL